nr:PREDICTED: uncharacterized protein LOC108203320 [Daucus carota subsp. sativus]
MHNLNDYHIDNLFGNLRAYEEDNVPDKVIPKVEDKKKNMALKSILIDEDENDEELNEELQNLDESEIALLTRQLRRVLQSKINQSPNGYNIANKNGTYTPPKPKEQNPEETPNVCFECKQPGHFKRECPKLSKGRILVAENGWDLSEDEETSEATEEVVNLCLMALEDDSSSSDISTSNDESNSVVQKDNEELVHALNEKDEIFELETQRLKDEHSKILAQVMNQERILNDKINILSKEKDDLERTIQKFTKGNELLDKMVHSKISYNHEGLGYDKNAQPKKFVQGKKQTTFVPATPKYKCSYCNKDGHTVEYCKIENGEIKGKYIWVHKGTKPYTKVDRFVPNNYVDDTQRKPKFSFVQKPFAYQNRNSGYNAYTNGQSSRSHFVPSHRFYPQNTMYYSNDKNNMYQGGNYQRYNLQQPRYYDYSRNNASRNSYMPTQAYTMPIFYNANVCLVTKRDMWYLDSGCSRHMTGNKSLLNSIRKVTAGSVTFGDSSKGSIVGIGDIGNGHFKIANVQLVTGLKYNLLSISQLCDNGYKVIFYPTHRSILNKDGKLMLACPRSKNVYTCDINKPFNVCLITTQDDPWLWHRRLGHANMKLIKNISMNDHVRGIPKLNYQKDHTCEACEIGKQIRASHKAMFMVSTSRPLELLHMDLVGPVPVQNQC